MRLSNAKSTDGRLVGNPAGKADPIDYLSKHLWAVADGHGSAPTATEIMAGALQRIALALESIEGHAKYQCTAMDKLAEVVHRYVEQSDAAKISRLISRVTQAEEALRDRKLRKVK